MDYSDNENNSEDDLIDEILGPQDLFNDEADVEDGDRQSVSGENPEDEAKEDNNEEKVEKKIKPKRIVRNPRVTLNFETLRGPNGLSALKKLFENFKFKGTNHEKEDLVKIIGILQQWMCYRLSPSYDFESVMFQLENLGKKKVVQTLLKKYRLGMDDWGENKSNDEDDDIDNVGGMSFNNKSVPGDNSRNIEFDDLLREDFANVDSDCEIDENGCLVENQVNVNRDIQKETEVTLTQEQLERIERNRKMAEERRLKRMREQQESMNVNEEIRTENSGISVETMNID